MDSSGGTARPSPGNADLPAFPGEPARALGMPSRFRKLRLNPPLSCSFICFLGIRSNCFHLPTTENLSPLSSISYPVKPEVTLPPCTQYRPVPAVRELFPPSADGSLCCGLSLLARPARPSSPAGLGNSPLSSKAGRNFIPETWAVQQSPQGYPHPTNVSLHPNNHMLASDTCRISL